VGGRGRNVQCFWGSARDTYCLSKQPLLGGHSLLAMEGRGCPPCGQVGVQLVIKSCSAPADERELGNTSLECHLKCLLLLQRRTGRGSNVPLLSGPRSHSPNQLYMLKRSLSAPPCLNPSPLVVSQLHL
jgi:hypothetical protein